VIPIPYLLNLLIIPFYPKCFADQGLIDIREAILRQLDDKDLTVVQAALNVDGLQNVLGFPKLLKALQNVLRRCIGKLLSGKCGIY
jgi:U3 small nucleolar RNA-associated protein 10